MTVHDKTARLIIKREDSTAKAERAAIDLKYGNHVGRDAVNSAHLNLVVVITISYGAVKVCPFVRFHMHGDTPLAVVGVGLLVYHFQEGERKAAAV